MVARAQQILIGAGLARLIERLDDLVAQHRLNAETQCRMAAQLFEIEAACEAEGPQANRTVH